MTDGHESKMTEGATDKQLPGRKGIQPRIVLLLLLGGSFAGIWLSHPDDGPLLRSVWWLVIVS